MKLVVAPPSVSRVPIAAATPSPPPPPPPLPPQPPQPPMAPQEPVQVLPSVPVLPPQPPMTPPQPVQVLPSVPTLPPPEFTSPPIESTPSAEDSPEEDLDATRVSTRRPAKAPWRLRMPDGSTVSVSSPVLIGRNPVSHASWPNAQLLLVVDKTKSVSKTHVAVETDDDGLWVTDLASTNGVVVTYSDGREVEAQGSERLNVDAGCGIELGRFIMLVEKN